VTDYVTTGLAGAEAMGHTLRAMQLIVAEKPSVARDIARALGVSGKGDGCIEGGGWAITWCLGHLVEFEEPDAYDPAWKRWSLRTLPMLPAAFKLRPVRTSASQWRVVRTLLRDRRFEGVVNACDAGREGELIFRLCHELSGSRLPVRRLWISSLTDAAIRQGFSTLQPGARYDALADAARCRAEADWLVGLNATRAVTVRAREHGGQRLYSVGRVQTPTLAMLVERERAIRAFKPVAYWEVDGAFTLSTGGAFTARFTFDRRTRFAREDLATQLIARVSGHPRPPTGPRVERLDTRRQKTPPPGLFDLTALQRTANARYGLSAQKTLDLAQSLYETHKLLSYPRTDARHLPRAMHAVVPGILRVLGRQTAYAGFCTKLLGAPLPQPARVFDDAKVRDHHAIIPTDAGTDPARLSPDEAKIYDLVVRRFLGAFYPDAEHDLTVAVVCVGPATDAAPPPPPVAIERAEPNPDEARDDNAERLLDALPPSPDRFIARGRVRIVAGWQEVAGFGDAEPGAKRSAKKPSDDSAEATAAPTLPPLRVGDTLTAKYTTACKATEAPRRYTEATLLAAMESAGRAVEDEALREALRERGLGTPATRASMIETLLAREYIVRQGKSLAPTLTGEALVAGLPVPALRSAELTGAWEERLVRMARGEETRDAFMRDIREAVVDLVQRVATGPGVGPAPVGYRTGVACPACGEGELLVGRTAYGCSRWREGCPAVIPFAQGIPGMDTGAARTAPRPTRARSTAPRATRAPRGTRAPRSAAKRSG
jgi:DNA topoisomerase-3